MCSASYLVSIVVKQQTTVITRYSLPATVYYPRLCAAKYVDPHDSTCASGREEYPDVSRCQQSPRSDGFGARPLRKVGNVRSLDPTLPPSLSPSPLNSLPALHRPSAPTPDTPQGAETLEPKDAPDHVRRGGLIQFHRSTPGHGSVGP